MVVEFGNSRLQEVADAWGAGAEVSEMRLQSMWRETVPLSWNSPLYRQFYETLREVNQERVCPRPVRIVLGDGPLDWSRIKTLKDFEPWGDRSGAIVATIECEVLAKQRRAFVLTGLAHAVKRALRTALPRPS